ncbi:MAG: tRNA (guanosine(46)-N7)-methyltransferase TrmB [Oscillospiraceae bacterium]
MRIRRKKWARPELDVCPFFVDYAPKMRGIWSSCYKSKAPLQLDLGCGKGIFTAGLALSSPQINYLAIDLKSDMLGVARRNIVELFERANTPVDNIILTPWDVERIESVLSAEDSVERIYINFCNPWPKAKQHKKRLTHTRQLLKYRTFMKKGADIVFKTDSRLLSFDTLGYMADAGFEVLEKSEDYFLDHEIIPELMSEHELRFVGQNFPIYFIRAIII